MVRAAVTDTTEGMVKVHVSVQVLDTAMITCCTLTGVHSFQLRGREWDVVVLDEAAQAMEVATWGALLRARRAVLAGMQLLLFSILVSRATVFIERVHLVPGPTLFTQRAVCSHAHV